MISQTLNEYAIKSVKTCLKMYDCTLYSVYQAVFVQQIFSLIYIFSDFYDQNYNNAAILLVN